jgi:hypothetical protein
MTKIIATKILRFLFSPLCLLFCVNVFADVVTLKDGSQISGQIESGTTRQIRIRVDGDSKVVSVDDIQSIEFGTPQVAARPSAGPSPVAPPVPREGFARDRTPPPPPVAPTITIPSGTEIAIRTTDLIDSKKADTSTEFRATLDDPVFVDGQQVIPAHVDAVLRIVDLKKAGMTSRALIRVALIAVTINGRRVEVQTADIESKSGSQAKHTAIGGAAGAGAGAAIGSAAGPLGAIIGAVAGAGAGAVVGGSVMKAGVKIQPETRFTYKLTEPVMIDPQGSPR